MIRSDLVFWFCFLSNRTERLPLWQFLIMVTKSWLKYYYLLEQMLIFKTPFVNIYMDIYDCYDEQYSDL